MSHTIDPLRAAMRQHITELEDTVARLRAALAPFAARAADTPSAMPDDAMAWGFIAGSVRAAWTALQTTKSGYLVDWHAERDALRAEVARLRAALAPVKAVAEALPDWLSDNRLLHIQSTDYLCEGLEYAGTLTVGDMRRAAQEVGDGDNGHGL